MVELLKSACRFRWKSYSVSRDESVDEDDRTAFKESLDNQMRSAEVIIVLAGVYATHSEWIGYEIGGAQDWNKPILRIRPWGSQRTSTAVQSAAARMLGWSSSTIVSAIRHMA